MKIAFGTVINNLDGSPAEINGQPLTLGIAAALALNSTGAPETSLKRGSLAMRLYRESGELEISPEEASMIRESLPQTFQPVIVAQVYDLLG